MDLPPVDYMCVYVLALPHNIYSRMSVFVDIRTVQYFTLSGYFCPQWNAIRKYIHVYVYISLCMEDSGQNRSKTLFFLYTHTHTHNVCFS